MAFRFLWLSMGAQVVGFRRLETVIILYLHSASEIAHTYQNDQTHFLHQFSTQ